MADSRLYFVGIDGQQSGPYREKEILDKIGRGEIVREALVWYDGLPEWRPVANLDVFAPAFAASPSGEPVESSSGKSVFKPLAEAISDQNTVDRLLRETTAANKVMNPVNVPVNANFSAKAAEPVFSADEATFSRARGGGRKQLLVLASFVGVMGLAGGAYFLYDQYATPNLQRRKPSSEEKVIVSREAQLRKAQSEIVLNSGPSVDTLKGLVKENAADDVGKQALSTLVDFYSLRSPVEAGRVLLEAKEPWDAATYFLKDPPSYTEAAQAYEQAFRTATDPVRKKEALNEEIVLSLGPLNDRARAVTLIKTYEQTFPGVRHPYNYYLKTADEKIRDIFDRISFYFVDSLLAFVSTELKQMNFEKRPLVQLLKEKESRYRIVGSYKGEVSLNHDKIPAVMFLFWLVKDQWVIIDSNLTTERKSWTKGERERLKDTSLTADEMQTHLENLFRAQFPKNALHERPSGTKH